MLHELLYSLHFLGMATIVAITLYLMFKTDGIIGIKKKLAIYLLSASHTQLLTGFALFFLMLPNVDHMKLGLKMILAIEIAIVATLYRKQLTKNDKSNKTLLVVIITSAFVATVLAFLMK